MATVGVKGLKIFYKSTFTYLLTYLFDCIGVLLIESNGVRVQRVVSSILQVSQRNTWSATSWPSRHSVYLTHVPIGTPQSP